MWSHRVQDADEIEEAGASIMAGMRLLAEHLDPPTAHALATQLLDELLRDMIKRGPHPPHGKAHPGDQRGRIRLFK
ncbi:MAG: hypothetical protein DIU71_18985, partial [Proteobacteria bacterium]